MAEYEIGYGKPPIHTRFRPGQSGNPKGRPKARLNLGELLKQILEEPVTIREGDRKRRVSKADAMLEVAFAKVMKGDRKAINAVGPLLKLTRTFKPVANPKRITSGVLMVPKGMDSDEFLARFLAEQAQYDEEDDEE